MRKASLVFLVAVEAVITATGAANAEAVRPTHPSPSNKAPLTALVEPNAGLQPIYRLIRSAHSSVDLSMYELNDATAEAELAADADRGLDVRVLLDQNLERARNTAAYDYLTSHGVHVHWATAGTTDHQKTLTIDDTTSAIMTLNLVQSNYASTRDFVVIDKNRADIAAIVATFDADFAGTSITPPDGADLVWSPTNAERSVLSIIKRAGHTLVVENEEMSDPAVISALAAAAHRGVRVEITMTADPAWGQAFQQLAKAGAHIRLYADRTNVLYIHAKAIVADAGRSDQEVLVGSQNFSVASLRYNRELGILTREPAVVSVVAAALASDFTHASASPAAATSTPPSAGRANCTASVSVYNATEHENNVYVRSDQPYQEATARADGYSASYEADGSGSAVIYLNGPRPGATVIVTIGDATCTTKI